MIEERLPVSMLFIMIALQTGSILIGLWASFFFWDSISIFFCALTFALIALCSWYICAKYHHLTRRYTWYVSRIVGGWVWLLSIFGYIVLFYTMPDAFTFSSKKLYFIAPIIACAPGFAALIMMLCTGDIVLFALGIEEKSGEQ